MHRNDESKVSYGHTRINESLLADSLVEAVYVPHNLEAAPPWALSRVGQRSKWLAKLVIEDGPYAGQWAMFPFPLPTTLDGPARGWVPLQHLREIRVLDDLLE